MNAPERISHENRMPKAGRKKRVHVSRSRKPKTQIPVVYTGGTIGQKPYKTQSGEVLKPFHTVDTFNSILKKNGNRDIIYKTHYPKGFPEDRKGIDSTNLTERQMTAIAEMVKELLSDAMGVMVIHGTDTMAQEAQYLALSLRNVSRPIVITGSQIHANNQRTDAYANCALATSLVQSDLAEVVVAFNGRAFRGSGVLKQAAVAQDAFYTPHAHPLAETVGNNIIYPDITNMRRWSNRALIEILTDPIVHTSLSSDPLTSITMSPQYATYPQQLRDAMLFEKEEYKASIIAGYAAGNIPSSCIPVLEEASKHVHVIVCPQAATQGVAEDTYEVSIAQQSNKVSVAARMTPSYAAMKHRWLLARARDLNLSSDQQEIEWVKSRYCLPCALEGSNEVNQILHSRLVEDLLNVPDIYEDLPRSTPAEIVELHTSIIKGQLQELWKRRAESLFEEGVDQKKWIDDRSVLRIPIYLDGNRAIQPDKLFMGQQDSEIELLDRIFESRELLGPDVVRGFAQMCSLQNGRAWEILYQWGQPYIGETVSGYLERPRTLMKFTTSTGQNQITFESLNGASKKSKRS